MNEQKVKPSLVAIIREAECIGCAKCISACPFDAILGTHQQLHTVISDECIGCKLCLPPCPVDCIDLVAVADRDNKEMAAKAKIRYRSRQDRLEKENEIATPLQPSMDSIQAAILRAKKLGKR